MRAVNFLPLVFSLLFGACGGGGGDGPAPDKTSPGGQAGTAPAITLQPASQSVPEGSTASFSVGATGTALTYQWRRNGAPIEGATASSYALPTVGLDDRGSTFSVVVSNAAGSVTSSAATLTVSGLRVLAGSASAYGYADGTGGEARFQEPFGVAVDASGNVFTADFFNHAIRQVAPDGKVTTLAGEAGVAGQVDGSGAAARFGYPTGVAVDANGNLYVADSAYRLIRRITPDGSVKTLMQLPKGTSKDGYTSGPFQPSGIAVDPGGYLYVTNGIGTRRIAPDLRYAMLEGDDTLDNVETSVLPTVRGVTLDAAGNLYLNSLEKSIRRLNAAGNITLPGTDGIQGYLASDSAGNIFIADSVNFVIRKISPSGVVTTVAGDGTRGTAFGTGLSASLPALRGIAVGTDGVLYVASGHAIIKVYAP